MYDWKTHKYYFVLPCCWAYEVCAWCLFRFIRKTFRRTKVSSLREIAQVVDKSAIRNVSQLIGDETEASIAPILNWSDCFWPHLKKISGIKQYHHFHFNSAHPGIVKVKKHLDRELKSLKLLKDNWNPDHTEMPAIVPVKPLSAERQGYLYESIRLFLFGWN